MGIGDEIMAAGQARRAYERFGVPVMIIDRRGALRTHPVWDNNPYIAQKAIAERYVKITNGPGARPYIAQRLPHRWMWKRFDLQPGEIFLTDEEKNFAAPFSGRVLIEPNTKGTNEGNKDWGWDRWVNLVENYLHVPMLQVGPAGTRVLPGVEFVETTDFRRAAAIMAVSRAFVGTEGGLHHAAAAFNVPGVVLFGGFISPDITGYKMHRNIFTGGTACGSRTACAHCRDAMSKIYPELIVYNLKEALK